MPAAIIGHARVARNERVGLCWPTHSKGIAMEGNVVKAAWILGGSLIASVALAGVGLFVGGAILSATTWKQLDVFSQRAANAVLEAPKHTRIAFDADQPLKVGFENKLPMALRIENSLDEAKGTRAPLVLKLNP